MEPLPRSVVPRFLLPRYGWPDQQRLNELSFRQTLYADRYTDRGFRVVVDRTTQTITIVFDSAHVAGHQGYWLQTVQRRTGLGPLKPQPHWNIQDLSLRVSTKMLNAFYVEVITRREGRNEFFKIESVHTLQGFNTAGFLGALEAGGVAVDFDARTHHNHGTKFRLREDFLPGLYAYVDRVV